MSEKISIDEIKKLFTASVVTLDTPDATDEKPSPTTASEAKPRKKKRAKASVTWTDYVQAATELGYSFRLNELDDSVEVNGRRMDDVTEAQLLSHLHARGLGSADVARRAFVTEAAQNRYHPVKQYLESLPRDGKDHIAALAGYFTDAHDPIKYADGSERTVFHAFQRRWLIGTVAKVYGAQNPMLILDGAQGKGKSHYVNWLCPLDGLYFDGAIKPEDKDYLGYVTTHWIWEVGELGVTLRRADREALKAFITLQNATYRPSYGRHALHKPALASFIGTVNFEGALLSDPTGHRRFWPVSLTDIDWHYADSIDKNQLWAQAYALYLSGESYQLSEEEKAVHALICADYEVEDVLEGHLHKWFTIEPGDDESYMTTTDIIDRLVTYASQRNNKGLEMQLATTLKRLGLRKVKHRVNGEPPRWGYAGIKASG